MHLFLNPCTGLSDLCRMGKSSFGECGQSECLHLLMSSATFSQLVVSNSGSMSVTFN